MKLTAFTGLLSWSSLRSSLPSLNPSAYAYPSVNRSSRTSIPESNVKTVVENDGSHYTVVVDINTTQLEISVD